MLIQEPRAMQRDLFLDMIAGANGNSLIKKEIQPGIYQVGHFGSTAYLPNYEHYPELEEIGRNWMLWSL